MSPVLLVGATPSGLSLLFIHSLLLSGVPIGSDFFYSMVQKNCSRGIRAWLEDASRGFPTCVAGVAAFPSGGWSKAGIAASGFQRTGPPSPLPFPSKRSVAGTAIDRRAASSSLGGIVDRFRRCSFDAVAACDPVLKW